MWGSNWGIYGQLMEDKRFFKEVYAGSSWCWLVLSPVIRVTLLTLVLGGRGEIYATFMTGNSCHAFSQIRAGN